MVKRDLVLSLGSFVLLLAASLVGNDRCNAQADVESTADSRSNALLRATPESQGVSTKQVLQFIREADKQVDSIHSLMIVRHGKVVTEAWWAPETATKPHILWSLSKSFTSTAVGLAVEEGKLSIDDPVIKFFPNQVAVGEASKNLAAMRVRDLLTMSAGHEREVNLRSSAGSWTEAFLRHPIPHRPGTHFKYNTPATYMLAAIVEKVTGESLVDYLQPRIFDPLGIEKPRWDKSPEGIALGGYGLFLKTEDIAKFGQLYLQKGNWDGKQLLPAKWIEMATSKQVPNGDNPDSDWNQGYGFQFWRCRHNAYRGDGKDGQFCIVLPEKDVVIAMTSNTRDMGKELSLVWEHLLPAFHDEPLDEDVASQKELQNATSHLRASR
ncbi:MAG: serine hydrolase domain-containing protein [Aureliella sp.]